jgi:hypothetical protein
MVSVSIDHSRGEGSTDLTLIQHEFPRSANCHCTKWRDRSSNLLDKLHPVRNLAVAFSNKGDRLVVQLTQKVGG